jgi:hypothetical protein
MSNILKDAMIDAKAVRATALANARAALSEAFSPRLEAMFNQKLKELEQPEMEDQSGIENIDLSSEPAPDASVDSAPVEQPASEIPVDSAPVEDPTLDQSIQESEDVALKGAPSGEKTEDKVGVNGQTKQAVKKDDKNVTAPLSGSAKADPKKQAAGEKTEDKVGVNGQTKQAVGKCDTNLTPALKENEEKVEDSDEKKELDEIISELEGDSSEEDVDDVDFENLKEEKEESGDDDEEIDLDEVFNSLKESDDSDADDKKEKDVEKLEEQTKALVKENADYKRALSYLKTKLNEVNLLNAKLLYTNKLFKAADLSNNQKLKIVEHIDLAKTVREVKYAYTLLSESINFGGKQPVKEVTTPVKKVVVPNKTVSTITEGLASKPVASTKPSKELLTEGAVMANRFQKLAGIKRKA